MTTLNKDEEEGMKEGKKSCHRPKARWRPLACLLITRISTFTDPPWSLLGTSKPPLSIYLPEGPGCEVSGLPHAVSETSLLLARSSSLSVVLPGRFPPTSPTSLDNALISSMQCTSYKMLPGLASLLAPLTGITVYPPTTVIEEWIYYSVTA